MEQMGFSRQEKALSLIIITSFFISLVFYNCGGGDDDKNGSSNSATLGWEAPTTNADGSLLTDLAGYKIYYGTVSGNYTAVIDVGNIRQYKVKDLEPGTYYFAVTAYDTARNESDYSNEVSKTIK
ncbi:MAG: fibronectin type III domain-containing protein [Nitrospirota bacterium]